MTEEERLLSGRPYTPSDPALKKMKLHFDPIKIRFITVVIQQSAMTALSISILQFRMTH